MITSKKSFPHIIIVGLPKSGTSILTYRIASGLKNSRVIFEPKQDKGLSESDFHDNILRRTRLPIVTKGLYVPRSNQSIDKIASKYDKRVWIYRDPRDWIISSFFYRWRIINKVNFDKTLARIQKKEEEPSEIPFKSLLSEKIINNALFNYEKLVSLLPTLKETWCVIKYKDLLDKNTEKLEDYLGFKLNHDVDIPGNLKRVKRSSSYDSWRTWFNEEDVEFFKPLFNEILSKIEYDPLDWNIYNPNKIDSTFGSGYVQYLYDEKMNKSRITKFLENLRNKLFE